MVDCASPILSTAYGDCLEAHNTHRDLIQITLAGLKKENSIYFTEKK